MSEYIIKSTPCELYTQQDGSLGCKALDYYLKKSGCLCGKCTQPKDKKLKPHLSCPVNIERMRKGTEIMRFTI